MRDYYFLTRMALTLLLMCGMLPLSAQKLNMDKEQADHFIYDNLNNNMSNQYAIETVTVSPSRLVKTDERTIFLLRGDYYQSETLRSDCYVRKNRNNYLVISDKRFPLETFTNQLLNKVQSGHLLQVKHHQYGQKIPILKTSLQSLFAMFMPTMKAFVSVTSINDDEIEAILLFHHPKLDFIHMLMLKTKTEGLLKKGNIIYGDLYTNIPQDNLSSILDR